MMVHVRCVSSMKPDLWSAQSSPSHGRYCHEVLVFIILTVLNNSYDRMYL
jgi:hypothetical protein